MNETDGFVLWVAGFTGVLLLYAAFKGESPLAVFQRHASGGKASTVSPVSTAAGTAAITGGVVGAVGASHGSVAADSTGTYYAYDGNGNMIGVVPDAYQNNPAAYIVGA